MVAGDGRSMLKPKGWERERENKLRERAGCRVMGCDTQDKWNVMRDMTPTRILMCWTDTSKSFDVSNRHVKKNLRVYLAHQHICWRVCSTRQKFVDVSIRHANKFVDVSVWHIKNYQCVNLTCRDIFDISSWHVNFFFDVSNWHFSNFWRVKMARQ